MDPRLTPEQRKWRREWIAALISGKFHQGRGALELEDGSNCCLGVLCRIVDPNCTPNRSEYADDEEGLSYQGKQLVGITEQDVRDLTNLNDLSKGRGTFHDIAMILEHLPRGFRYNA